MAQVKLECGILDNIKRVKGRETDCIWGMFHTQKSDIHVTYNCENNVLLIHEWYNLPESERENVADILRRYFESLV